MKNMSVEDLIALILGLVGPFMAILLLSLQATVSLTVPVGSIFFIIFLVVMLTCIRKKYLIPVFFFSFISIGVLTFATTFVSSGAQLNLTNEFTLSLYLSLGSASLVLYYDYLIKALFEDESTYLFRLKSDETLLESISFKRGYYNSIKTIKKFFRSFENYPNDHPLKLQDNYFFIRYLARILNELTPNFTLQFLKTNFSDTNTFIRKLSELKYAYKFKKAGYEINFIDTKNRIKTPDLIIKNKDIKMKVEITSKFLTDNSRLQNFLIKHEYKNAKDWIYSETEKLLSEKSKQSKDIIIIEMSPFLTYLNDSDLRIFLFWVRKTMIRYKIKTLILEGTEPGPVKEMGPAIGFTKHADLRFLNKLNQIEGYFIIENSGGINTQNLQRILKID
jgi:hypothetical protein